MTTPQSDLPPTRKPQPDPAADRAVLAEFDRQVRRLGGKIQNQFQAVVDPEDLANSGLGSFVRAYGLPADPAGWDQFRHLLDVVVDNKLKSRIRHHSRQIRDVGRQTGLAADPVAPGGEAPDGAAEEADLFALLAAGLGAREWQVLRMYLAGHTAEEIAAEIGQTPRTVFRILKHFRDRADQYVKRVSGTGGAGDETAGGNADRTQY